MPELPEVETVRRGLLPVMEGGRIIKTTVNRPDLRWPFPSKMAERLTDVRVNVLRRRSKYLLFDLSSGETLIVHLGMSGRILISGDPQARFHHSHAPTMWFLTWRMAPALPSMIRDVSVRWIWRIAL